MAASSFAPDTVALSNVETSILGGARTSSPLGWQPWVPGATGETTNKLSVDSSDDQKVHSYFRQSIALGETLAASRA